MKKTVTFNKEASDKLVKGINIICDAVRQTLGAGGRVVLIEDFYGNPKFTKDGVSVAKEINLSNPIENLGAQLMKQIAIKTVNSAGDGTTTSLVIAQELIKQGLIDINNGKDPIELIREIKSYSLEVIKNIRSQSVPIKGNWERVKQVSVIATNGDEKHSTMLVDAMKEVGEDGVIMIEYGTAMETKVNIVNGITFSNGYMSPLFINNTKNECVLENPLIFVTTGTVSFLEEVLPALQNAKILGRPLLFISNSSDGEGLATIIKQRTVGDFPLCIVNAPSYGAKRKEHLIDIAITTGSAIFGTEFGKEMKLCKQADMGQAECVIVSKDKTIIIGGKGEKSRIEKRIESIRTSIETEENDEEKEWYKSRLASINGGIGIMKVGGITQMAISELKDRLDDALCATKAAIEDGIVPGGGVAYLNAMTGESVNSFLAPILTAPFGNIMSNAGMVNYIQKFLINRKKDSDEGLNVRTGNEENFLETGIIDATKVVICAFENAVDVACLILQNNVIITNIPKESSNK